eukprot:scaffold373870_cov38-Prasinocladus_malaysianus.AAC.1
MNPPAIDLDAPKVKAQVQAKAALRDKHEAGEQILALLAMFSDAKQKRRYDALCPETRQSSQVCSIHINGIIVRLSFSGNDTNRDGKRGHKAD